MNKVNSSNYNVLQYTTCWLQQTMVWLYEQIVHLAPPFIPYVVCEELKNLDQFNIENIYCGKTLSQFIRWQRNNSWRLGLMPVNKHIEEMSKNIDISIIHSHFGNVAWMNLKSVNKLMVPHIASFYGYDVSLLPTQSPKWKQLYQQLFSKIDLVLALGKNMASELEKIGCQSQKIVVHHLGVDLSNLPYRPRKWHNKQPLCILIAGSFKEKKGIPYALAALANIKKFVNLEITIIGDATASERDQSEKKRIIDTVQRLNLKTTVKFLGYQPYRTLIEEAYKHHIFLAPSITASDGDTEGIPMTIVEMAATGMPIISTYHSDIPEIINNEETGWLVKERDADAITACLHSLIIKPERWAAVLKAGRHHIETEFDVKKQIVKISEIYRKQLRQRA